MATANSEIDTYTYTSGRYIITKDPDAVLDYALDWTAWLATVGDQIVAAEIIADTPLVVENTSFDGNTVTGWISGGAGATGLLRVTYRITTDNVPPRIDDRSIWLKIAER